MTIEPKYRTDVFLSSTSRDLAEHRKSAQEAIVERRMYPIVMESFGAISRDATDVCRRKVEEADLFVGIYGYRYGYCPNQGTVSITELEYQWAEAKALDRLIFVVDPAYTWPDDHPIRRYADDDPRLQDFLNRIGQKIVWTTFTSPEDLKYKVAKAIENWEKDHRQRRYPQGQRLILLGLWGLILMVFGWTAFDLLSADAALIGGLLALTGLLLPLIPMVVVKNIRLALTILVGLVLLAVVLRWPLRKAVADQKLQSGLQTDNISQAEADLEAAERLGLSVKPEIEHELLRAIDQQDKEAAIRYTTLYQRVARSSDTRQLAEKLAEQLTTAAAAENSPQALLLAELTTILDPTLAGTIAADFNDSGVQALSQNELVRGRIYLEAARILDRVSNGRSNEAKSITRYNLGLVFELSGDTEAAIVAYREAINELNDANLEARYALSSLLLIQFSDDSARLNEAIQIAQNGQDYIEPRYCRGVQDLSYCSTGNPDSEAAYVNTWQCFLLMTTEAGARLQRNDPNQGDVQSTIEPLIRRAINLAEDNGQFKACASYTAEAYYYLAQVTAPDTDKAILCNIIAQRNPNSPRHQQWVEYANEQLGEQTCLP
ncbi:MAG: DUF4062 domain-containing protein [Anaerolineales bacterium]|nr:DUF4062 domain-containing protein [Anaerolineales bacterium]